MLKNILKGTFILIAGILILGSTYVQGETLPEAIQQVLVTHPEIRAAAYNRQARDEEVIQARGPYYPTLDGSMSWGILQEDRPTTDRVWPTQTTVSLRQNLFRGGANYYDVQRQKGRVNSQAYLIRGLSENVSLLTAKVYMAVLRATEISELAKENLTNHERIADQVKLRMQSGVDARADLEQVMGRLALAQSNVAVTTANLRDARTDYLAVVNKIPENLAKLQPLNVAFPTSLDEAEKIGLRDYPIVQSAKADLAARKSQYEVARRLLSPSLDIAADYNWTDQVSTSLAGTTGKRDYFAATAVVSMNFFNGLRNQGRIKETMYLINEAEQILTNAERQTVQSIRLSWEAYTAAKDRVKYLQEYVKSTEATAAAFAAQWNLGRRTMFDLLDTQAETINAKSDLAKAKYDLFYAEYRILSGMGKLVHSLGLQWPAESRIAEEVAIEIDKKEKAAAAPKADEPVKAAEPAPKAKVAETAPAAPKAAEGYMETDKAGFMKADKDGFIKSPQPVESPKAAEPAAAVPKAVEPPKAVKSAAPAPKVVEPVKPAPAPASDITSDGFIKADKDGFIRSR